MGDYSYNFGQYNYNNNENMIFVTPYDCNSISIFRETQINAPYFNIGYYFGGKKFASNTSYYFNGVIKKLDGVQEYRVYLGKLKSDSLVNISNTIEINEKALQPIAYLNIEGISQDTKNEKTEDNYQEIEFMFQPYNGDTYDCIIFSLIRGASDYGYYDSNGQNVGRDPIILLKEIDVVNNVINTVTNTNVEKNSEIIKMSVSSIADFSMSINNEAIKTNKSGVYELIDGFITVNNFGIYGPASYFYLTLQTEDGGEEKVIVYNGTTSESDKKSAIEYYPNETIFSNFLNLKEITTEEGKTELIARNYITWNKDEPLPFEVYTRVEDDKEIKSTATLADYLWVYGTTNVVTDEKKVKSWRFNDFTIDYVYRTPIS